MLLASDAFLRMTTNQLTYFPDDQASKDLVSVQVQSDRRVLWAHDSHAAAHSTHGSSA